MSRLGLQIKNNCLSHLALTINCFNIFLFISKVEKSVAPLSQSLPADSTKIWSEKHGSFLSFDEEPPAPRKESEVSLLSSQLKELEDKTQEILYLQQELNELNASLKEEKWYSAALKEEVDKITKEKVELEEKNSVLEKVFLSFVF